MLGKRAHGSEESLFGSKRLDRIEVVNKSNKKGGKKGAAKATGGVAAAVQPPGAPGKDVTRVEPLSFTKYKVGTLAMGYVLSFGSTFVVVSLPGGLTGVVPVEEISDTMHQLCATAAASGHKGGRGGGKASAKAQAQPTVPAMQDLLSLMQPVRCYIKEVHTTEAPEGPGRAKRSLVLSLRSSLVHRGLALKHLAPGFPLFGCVASKEDRGYVVSAGVGGCTFFLPFERMGQADGKGNGDADTDGDGGANALKIGQPVECLVHDVNASARSVTLRTHAAALVKATVTSPILPFTALAPGMKLSVKVDAVVSVRIIHPLHPLLDPPLTRLVFLYYPERAARAVFGPVLRRR